jgi:hypothetical protein
MSLVKKKKKLFENHVFDATHTITVVVVEVDFLNNVIIKKRKKKKNFI